MTRETGWKSDKTVGAGCGLAGSIARSVDNHSRFRIVCRGTRMRRLAVLAVLGGSLLLGACGTPHNPAPLQATAYCPMPHRMLVYGKVGPRFTWGTCYLPIGVHMIQMLDGQPELLPGERAEIVFIGDFDYRQRILDGGYYVLPAGYPAS